MTKRKQFGLPEISRIPGKINTQLDLFASGNETPMTGVVAQCDGIDTGAVISEIIPSLVSRGLDLIYVDPPFNNDEDFKMRVVPDSNHQLSIDVPAFSDRWASGIDDYLQMLSARLVSCYDLLAPAGWLAVHVDWKTDYRVRQLLEQIFGGPSFWRNTIYWRRDPGGKGPKARTRQFPRNCDSIILFNKSQTDWYFNLPRIPLTDEQRSTYRNVDENGRHFKAVDARNYSDEAVERMRAEGNIYTSSAGKAYKKYYMDESEGVIDMLWTDIPGFGVRTGAHELVGYPTQKPLALIERLICALCPEGGWVGDVFCGSGTTGIAALKTNRNFVISDVSSLACELARLRLHQTESPAGCNLKFISTKAGADLDKARIPSTIPELPISARIRTDSDDDIRNGRYSLDIQPASSDHYAQFVIQIETQLDSNGKWSESLPITAWLLAAYIGGCDGDSGFQIGMPLNLRSESSVDFRLPDGLAFEDVRIVLVDIFGRKMIRQLNQ
jgi:DNA modification methylase